MNHDPIILAISIARPYMGNITPENMEAMYDALKAKGLQLFFDDAFKELK